MVTVRGKCFAVSNESEYMDFIIIILPFNDSFIRVDCKDGSESYVEFEVIS